jgi:hypothetical protein
MLAHLRKLVPTLAALASVVGLLRSEVYRDVDVIRAGWRANDGITLLVAVPLFLWASHRARNGSVRGRLVEIGVLHFLAYDFAFYLFGAALNVLFPVYVALVAGSFWTIVLALRELDLRDVPRSRASGVVAWMLFVALGLTTTWTAQWLVALLRTTEPGRFDLTPEFVRVVAAVDLTMLVSFLVPGALLLRKGSPWGVVIAAAVCVSGALYNLVLAGGTLVQIQMGLSGGWPMLALWCALGVGCAIAAGRLLRRPVVCFAESA